MTTNLDSQSTAIPFIYLQNEKFIVSQEAKQFLSEIKNPICVLTIVGKYRTGKSLFLNRIMLGKSKAFKVSPTINSCTRGLWLWKDTLKFENEEQEKEVLIIDTEGFGATEESDAYNNKILLFALLLSSYFVYNSVGSIDENSLNTISVLANLANEIQSKNSKDENIEQYFPSFLWLVRDFTLNLVDKNDFPIQPKEYLEQALEIQKGTSNLIEGKNRIRRMMKHFFIDRDCFTLVRPVETEDKLQQLDTLEEKDFRETFLEQAKTLRQKILMKIKPKKLKNTLLTGESLLELAENYVEVINSNSLPNFESSYKHLLRIEMSSMKKRICGEYEKKARQLVKESFFNIKSQQEFEQLKQNLVIDVEKQSKEQIKCHNSLSAFVNSEEIILLVNEIKSFVSILTEKIFHESKEEMRHKYAQIVSEIQEDNMMSQSLESIENDKQFREFINGLNEKLTSSLVSNSFKCPEFLLNEYYDENFLPYIQSLHEQFSQLSTKRLSEENKEMKIKLQMKEEYAKEKELIMIKMDQDLKDERKLRSELELKVKMLEKELTNLKENSEKKELHAQESINLLRTENLTLNNECVKLQKELETKNAELNNLNEFSTQKTHELNLLDKELALTNERLQNKIGELDEKKSIIEALNSVLNEKNSKIESLITKIEELRESKEELYGKFNELNQETSIKIVNLEKTNTKLSMEIKEFKKFMEKSEIYSNETIKSLKDQLNREKERYQSLLEANENLNENVKHMQNQVESFNKKEEKYREFKKCIKNSSSIQCLHCTRFFMSSIFLTHLTVCASFNSIEGQSVETNKIEEIEFKVTNTVLHENSGKPFTVYQIECLKGNKKWMIEKKFTEFCELNENLRAALPGMELSSAETIFDPKYLSKKSLSVEEKQFLIERYFNDLGRNVKILSNKYWQEFMYSKVDNESLVASQPVTRRTALNELTETNNTSNNQLLNYQMRKSQVKEEPAFKSNNSQSLKRESVQTPEEFFKIWEQKQLRSKPSTTCLKKTINH